MLQRFSGYFENYAMPVMYVNHYSRSSLQQYRYGPLFYADLQNVGSVHCSVDEAIYSLF